MYVFYIFFLNLPHFHVAGTARDVFEKVLVVVRESYRSDKRLLRDVMADLKIVVKHDSSLEETRLAIYTAAGLEPEAKKEDGTSDDINLAEVYKNILVYVYIYT
jgi:hypothetical protein